MLLLEDVAFPSKIKLPSCEESCRFFALPLHALRGDVQVLLDTHFVYGLVIGGGLGV